MRGVEETENVINEQDYVTGIIFCTDNQDGKSLYFLYLFILLISLSVCDFYPPRV